MPRAAAGAQGYGRLGEQRAGAAEVGDVEAFHASGSGRQPPDLISTPGNIRVLCRLRPGTPSSLVSLEPGPGGTVTTCYRGHQRRFRLDWVFPPHASQEEVMLHPFTCVACHSEFPGDQRRLPVCLPSQERGRLDSSREGKGAGGSGRQDWYSSWAPTFFPGFPLCIPPPNSTGWGRQTLWLKQED